MESNQSMNKEKVRGLLKELHEVEQILGDVLCFPRYSYDQKNFPDAKPEDGICVGVHTAVTLSITAAKLIKKLQALLSRQIANGSFISIEEVRELLAET